MQAWYSETTFVGLRNDVVIVGFRHYLSDSDAILPDSELLCRIQNLFCRIQIFLCRMQKLFLFGFKNDFVGFRNYYFLLFRNYSMVQSDAV